ncbi:hypothetical protein FLA_0949 [Filimonas lacunae]|nr:hypothetical protein FLA_0949 [Filimonas lacunae]
MRIPVAYTLYKHGQPHVSYLVFSSYILYNNLQTPEYQKKVTF